MAFQSRTALVTGGGTGIGRGLAEAMHRRGTKVVIAGRRREVLEIVCQANPGMAWATLDVTDRAQVRDVARALQERHGPFDCVIDNAGVQRPADLTQALPEDFADAEIDLNLRAFIDVINVWLPHLRAQPAAALISVTSGLAFVPLARVPVYCATKAAARSFTLSLRHQLRGTAVRVIELIPPAVTTELHDYMGPAGRSLGMPLDAFVREAMEGLDAGALEITVGHAKHLSGTTEIAAAFERMNSAGP